MSDKSWQIYEFTNGSPFGSHTTESELSYLKPALFAKVDDLFNQILPFPYKKETQVFFGGPGMGKSYLAHMIKVYSSDPSLSRHIGKVLPIELNAWDFDAILRGSPPPDLNDITKMQDTYRKVIFEKAKKALAHARTERNILGSVNLDRARVSIPNFATLLDFFSHNICGSEIEIIYVLVDGIENVGWYQGQTKVDHIAKLIAPLLMDNILLSTNNVTFKFFLPQGIQKKLEEMGALNPAYCRTFSEIWHWSIEDLTELLQKRIRYFSHPEITNLSSLGKTTPPRYLEIFQRMPDIDLRVCLYAEGNPRNLIRLCAKLEMEHIVKDVDGIFSEHLYYQAHTKYQATIKQEQEQNLI